MPTSISIPTHTNNHWSNENSMIQAVFVPYINRVRQDILKDEEQAALVIFDCFKGQVTESVIDALEDTTYNQ